MKKTLLTAALLVASATAFGQQPAARTGYAGATLGESRFWGACDTPVALGFTCDMKDTAWRVFGGYRLTRTFAFEAGYADLGEVKVLGAIGGQPAGGSVKATLFDFVGVGSYLVDEQFSVYGKLGLYHGDAKTSANAQALGLAGSASSQGTDFTFGFGAQYFLTPHIAMRFDWQRYSKFAGRDTDVIAIGALYSF